MTHLRAPSARPSTINGELARRDDYHEPQDVDGTAYTTLPESPCPLLAGTLAVLQRAAAGTLFQRGDPLLRCSDEATGRERPQTLIALSHAPILARASMTRWGRGAAPLMLEIQSFIGSLRSRPFTIIALALTACSTQRSSESQSSYAQKVDTVTEEGSWTVRTWEFAPAARSPNDAAPKPMSMGSGPSSTSQLGIGLHAGGASTRVAASDTFLPAGELLRYTEETHEPTTIHSDSAVQASGSAKAESKSRPFGIFALLAAGWPFLLGACGAAALVIMKPPWLIASWSIVKSIFRRSN